jgi:hypothetical protein
VHLSHLPHFLKGGIVLLDASTSVPARDCVTSFDPELSEPAFLEVERRAEWHASRTTRISIGVGADLRRHYIKADAQGAVVK